MCFLRLSTFCLAALIVLFDSAGPASAGPSGPDPRYLSYEQILDRFDAWEEQYPEIFHREIIGRSTLGEPIWGARISDNPSVREPEPSLLFHAAQHSNEANGTNAILFMMERLLTRYGHDPHYTAMVDGLESWFIPIINVDGHRLVFRGCQDWQSWRKTARDNDHNGTLDLAHDGVDMNRNWDYRWADYDSLDYRSPMYKGPHPFSEPEVVALRDFILREMPVFVIDYHSPGTKTYPNMIFWPWFERGPQRNGIDAMHYRPITQALAGRCLTQTDTLYYNGDWYAYDTLPKEQCWVYKHTGICILLMEISTQFWWEGAIVDTIAARVGRGSFYLMEHALSGPGIQGRVTDADTGRPMIAEIRVAEAHDPGIGPRRTDHHLGCYWRFLSPGTYTIMALADGYTPITETLAVRDGQWTRRDFELRARKP